MSKINKFYNFSNENNNNKSGENIRNVIKIALENMYMFGGMPKPDSRYESYLESTIEYVMKAIKKEYDEK